MTLKEINENDCSILKSLRDAAQAVVKRKLWPQIAYSAYTNKN